MYKYKRVRLSRSKTRDLHRIIFEEFLGRKLSRNEVVHHKNGNKSDNRLCNLQLMSNSDHARLHGIGRNFSDATRKKLSIKNTKPNYRCRKLPSQVVLLIINSNLPDQKLAEIYSVGKTTIHSIRARTTYKEVDGTVVYGSPRQKG